MNLVFYSVVVLVWGSTWIAIANQVGEVSNAASIFYRSALAGLLLFAYLLVRRQRLRFTFRQHVVMGVIGASMFSVNYLFLYAAEERIPSGLVAVLFAMTLPFNVINSWIFLRQPLSPLVLVATAIGITGIVMMFWDDVVGTALDQRTIVGAALALGGATCFSLGNIVSAHSQAGKLPVVASEAYGLIYGALLLVPVALSTGGFGFSLTFDYLWSLGYLVVFGSVIGFALYLTILGRIGADRAGYITVLFPVVALLWSTLFENYVWTVHAVAGAVIVLVGCALAVTPPHRLIRSSSRRGGDVIAFPRSQRQVPEEYDALPPGHDHVRRRTSGS